MKLEKKSRNGVKEHYVPFKYITHEIREKKSRHDVKKHSVPFKYFQLMKLEKKVGMVLKNTLYLLNI